MLELQNDDPWMLARLIQYCYTGHYDYAHYWTDASQANRTDISIWHVVSGIDDSFTLDMMMKINENHTTFRETKIKDRSHTVIDIDLAMYVMADRYLTIDMMAFIRRQLETRSGDNGTQLKAAFGKDIAMLVDRDENSKKMFANLLAKHYRQLRTQHNDWLTDKLQADPELSALVIDATRLMHQIDTIALPPKRKAEDMLAGSTRQTAPPTPSPRGRGGGRSPFPRARGGGRGGRGRGIAAGFLTHHS